MSERSPSESTERCKVCGRDSTGKLYIEESCSPECYRLGYGRVSRALAEAEKAKREAENEMVAAESQLEWLSDAITGARPIDDYGLSFGVVREAVDLRTRAEAAEGRLAEAERALELSCRFGRADTIKLVEVEASLRAAEERAAQAERALTELLRLYDWRFELAGREGNPRNETETEFQTETRRLLRRYGTEKKAAWEAARAAILEASKARAPKAPPETCACGEPGSGDPKSTHSPRYCKILDVDARSFAEVILPAPGAQGEEK